MLIFFLRRLLILIPVWLALVTLIFLMRVLIPGDPIDTLLFGQPHTPEVVANLKADLGLDKPLYEQYFNYVVGAAHGDLGKSITTRRPVIDEIGDRYVKTLTLAVSSLVLALVLGLVFGTIAAMYKGTFIDTAVTVVSLIGLSLASNLAGVTAAQFVCRNPELATSGGQGRFSAPDYAYPDFSHRRRRGFSPFCAFKFARSAKPGLYSDCLFQRVTP